MLTRRQVLARLGAVLGAGAAGVLRGAGQEQASVLRTKSEKLIWKLRDLVAGVEDLLEYRGSRIINDRKKTVLYAWWTKKKPPPGMLSDGRLLALLVPRNRLSIGSLVTARSVENGRAAEFSTVELERADRMALRLIYDVGEWRNLGVATPLARLTDDDPLWQVLPPEGNGVTLSQFEGEYHLIFVFDRANTDGYRCSLPERVAKILDL
jgi:hypothetical protein